MQTNIDRWVSVDLERIASDVDQRHPKIGQVGPEISSERAQPIVVVGGDGGRCCACGDRCGRHFRQGAFFLSSETVVIEANKEPNHERSNQEYNEGAAKFARQNIRARHSLHPTFRKRSGDGTRCFRVL